MNDLTETVIALTALVSALGGLVPVVVALWRKVSRQQRQWEEFRTSRWLRGTAEALRERLAVEQIGCDDEIDPDVGGFLTIAVTPATFKAYERIVGDLVDLRKRYTDLSAVELGDVIERRFGPWLARYVCVPLGVSNFACVVMAVSIADGIKPAELPDHDSKMHRAL
jgi:hypothetical protein